MGEKRTNGPKRGNKKGLLILSRKVGNPDKSQKERQLSKAGRVYAQYG